MPSGESGRTFDKNAICYKNVPRRDVARAQKIENLKWAGNSTKSDLFRQVAFCWVPLPLVAPPFGDCNARSGKAGPAQILRFAPNFTAHQRRGPEGPYLKWAGNSKREAPSGCLSFWAPAGFARLRLTALKCCRSRPAQILRQGRRRVLRRMSAAAQKGRI